MTTLTIAVLALTSLVSAKPAFLPVPLTYATLTPGGQIGANAGPLDNPEVAVSRTQRVLEDRANLAPQVQRQSPGNNGLSILTAPLGADGRVVDTAEVAAAKAAHAAAHVNERLNLANEAARSAAADSSAENGAPDTLAGPDVPEVNEKIHLASEVVRSDDALTRIVDAVVPLVLGNGVVVTALVPIQPDDGLPGSPEAHGNPAADVKTVDALAVAGPALAYGRLVY